MFKFFKKKSQPEGETASTALTWDPQATQALDQATAQAPVPGMLKKRLRSELAKTAEAEAVKAGHTTVTAQDLMAGMLSKMPPAMRAKVEAAAKQGPEALKNLEQDLKNQK